MSEQPDPAPKANPLGPSPWTWMILACVVIAGSGLIRVNQERAFADAARSAEQSPFPIRDLPRELGSHWKMVGDERNLDAETLQIAGCSDYLYRQYVDSRTGVTLTVLVSFGPAMQVFPHSPIVCYPANGYSKRAGPVQRSVKVGDDGPGDRAVFSVLAYDRPGGGLEDLKEVYYTYWHDGQWDPDASETKRRFYHRPAMFKIQVERPITSDEINAGSPIEEFVAALVPEINRRIEQWAGETSADD